MKNKTPTMETHPEDSYPQGGGDLIDHFKAWQSGSIDQNRLASYFYAAPRVKTIVRYLAHKNSLADRIDEAMQATIARFFTGDTLQSVTHVEGLFSLVYRVAENAVRQMADEDRRWNIKHETLNRDDIEHEDIPIDDFTHDLITRMDNERAKAEFANRARKKPSMLTETIRKPRSKRGASTLMPAHNLGDALIEATFAQADSNPPGSSPLPVNKTVEPTPDSMKLTLSGERFGSAMGALVLAQSQLQPPDLTVVPTQKKELSPAALELKAIRNRVGYNVDQFARVLDIPKEKLSAAMYGRIDPVPEAYMVAAREFLEVSLAEVQAREQTFDQFGSMDEMVKHWLGSLELEDNRKGEMTLATILGVYHSTLFRWRKGNYKPTLKDMERYQLMVSQAREQLKVIQQTWMKKINEGN